MKFPLLGLLLIFHSTNDALTATGDPPRTPSSGQGAADDSIGIKQYHQDDSVRVDTFGDGDEKDHMNPPWCQGQETRIKDKVGEAQIATIKALKCEDTLTRTKMSQYKNEMKDIVEASSEKLKETLETKMGETNTLLQEAVDALKEIKQQKEDKTFNDTTALASQVKNMMTAVNGSALHLFTGEVRYPQEALGLMSLQSDYNKKVAPKYKKVKGWMRPTFLMDIDSMKQRMGLEIYFILMWQEDNKRVDWALEDKMEDGVAFSFGPSVLEDMWTPDVVFDNQVSLERASSTIKNESDAIVEIMKMPCNKTSQGLCQEVDLTRETTGIRIFLKQTVKVEVNCPKMQFGNFPFDKQQCLFTVNDLHLKENPRKSNFELAVEILPLVENLNSTEFTLSVENSTEIKNGFQMKMVRKTTVYIYTYFIPCGLMVVVSWISFSVNVDAVPGRLGLLLTLLLMTINMNNSAAQAIPTSEEICPLIIWILLSMGFISFALFEYFALLILVRYDKEVKAKVEPPKKGTSDKTRRRILLMDQFSLFTVPVVYVLAVAIFMATNV